MNERIEQLKFALEGGQTKRWHTWPMLQEDIVASHSFGVAWICHYLMGDGTSANLLLAALSHDLPEQQLGDIPSQTKRKVFGKDSTMQRLEDEMLDKYELNYMRKLTSEETLVLGFADTVDMLANAIRERRLGNKHISIVWERAMAYANEKLDKLPIAVCARASNYLYALTADWERYHGEVQ